MARYALEQRSTILAQQLENESVRDFSHRVGVSDGTIYNWRKQMAQGQGGFKPLEITSESTLDSGCFLTIHVDNIKITIHQYVKADYISSLLGW